MVVFKEPFTVVAKSLSIALELTGVGVDISKIAFCWRELE